ncbi:SDR family NAD(P)-dependent oxidoreductase [Halobacteriovorax sp. ZH4_bin.1]|uniref:SDR family NAD(P)-dependent oxidoreductase n=1 Tax=unclassified Halobacteriovorax TaxID=2639665 RepID=UPI0037118082
MNFRLNKCQNALIIGAGHGIGFGIVQNLLENYSGIFVKATYRRKKSALDLLNLKKVFPNNLEVYQVDPSKEDHLKNLAQENINNSFDLIINSVGFLHTENISPEKSLREFDPDTFLELIRVNAMITPLLAKYLEKNLSSSPSLFATISAKVGSIEDNKIGGWYSYRASKAALNMLIKNIAIEFERKRKKCLVLAIHPGTTRTDLSEPFIERTSYIIHETHETASNILNIINNRELNETGKFLSWDGGEIPW